MTQNGKGSSWQLNLVIFLTSAGVIAISIAASITKSAFAQSVIIHDQTLGTERSEVIDNYNNNPTEAIAGGAIRGTNLFHSFQEFNVNEGRSALFLAPNTSIQNILVRVTGNNRSDIFGKLETSGANANLFVINPNGIFFGPNASLNIGGSFVASTASGIEFGDDLRSVGNHRTIFSATSPQALLTMSVPTGLQFGRTGGEINVQGTLAVPTGKTLALVGGNITLDGNNISFINRKTLNAESGQIAIGGIQGVGTVGLNLDGNNINNQILSFPRNAVLADVFLKNQARVDVSGQGAGYIEIKGRQVGLTRASQVVADTEGSQSSRGILIQAENLTLQEGSQVTASVNGINSTGSGGNLTVRATDSVQVRGIVPNGLENPGNPSGLFTLTLGKGSGGSLTIETSKLIVEDGGNVSASTRGNTLQSGVGGTVNITATDFVKVSGNTRDTRERPSGIFAQTSGAGDAGSLTINTPILFVQDGAVISAGTLANSQGDGGNLIINAKNFIEISGKSPIGKFPSGLFARSRGSGDAGSILITTGKLIMRDQALVTVEALGGGNAGKIDIKASEINLDGGANVNATTRSGNGGDINLQIENKLLLRRNSLISTTAGIAGGGGNGGNITIKIPNGFIIAVPGENSDIKANAFDGEGGNVSINAFGIFGIEFRKKDSPLTNDITASSEFGLNGTVEINTPEVQPNQGLINLPNQPIESRLAQVCKAVPGRNRDSFTIIGRGGLPNSPNELLHSDAVIADWIAVNNVEKTSNTTTTHTVSTPTPTNIVEATAWMINSQGELVLTANAPITKSHNSWQQATACNVHKPGTRG
ncbi:two-partner secretion domain-containing protein [Anabaena subtropica]|uniref:Filamentous hemagglutinin N-terminal domain-containing protein n=1 Tax=Anabaena subtropica FACHB-260 TaxID=2692884 RepID=A0ABR8CN70_9NOST|nr:filamentous hemagglutinin N-terminal domain-containing protein [Anabaena subtropica]MBD2344231.1 filamentous hemagglutinin N-terminal domain-containing protein [Anabaena subtropica FACHB-260]